MKKAVILTLCVLMALVMSCSNKSEHVHEWDEGTAIDDKATFLTKGPIKYTCSICNEAKTEDGFLSVEGYWKSQVNEFNLYGSDYVENLYFSLDNSSSGTMERLFSKKDEQGWTGIRKLLPYTWITDSDGNRTGIKITLGDFVNKKAETYDCTVSESKDNSGKRKLTITTPEGVTLFSTEIRTIDLERIDEKQHKHSGLTQRLKDSDSTKDYCYHDIVETACKDTLHPQLTDVWEEHTFDSKDSETAELCSICGKEREYVIILRRYVDDKPSDEKVLRTRKEGYILASSHFVDSKEEEIYSWKKEDGTELKTGERFYPEKDYEVLVYTLKAKPEN